MNLLEAPYALTLVIYLLFFVIATGFTIVMNHLLLKFLKDIGVRNRQNGHDNLVRWAAQTKPSIGGFSFFTLFLLAVCSYFILPFQVEVAVFNRELFALIASVTLGFLIGLIDDSYNTPPLFKFVGQLGCTAIMLSMGVMIHLTGIVFLDALFTTLWVVGVMNSINMLDNMDGITASVSACISLAVLGLIYTTGNFNDFYTITTLGVLASLIGFLYFNWHPAKMYMGDTGSQFLGAFLAFVGIVFMWNFPWQGEPITSNFSIQAFLIPMLAFLLPIIDTTTVSVYRLKRGQSPFMGGRDHTTHHLAYCGFKDAQVTSIFAGLSLVSVAIIAWISLNYENWTLLKSILTIVYCVSIYAGILWMYEKGKKRQQEIASKQEELETNIGKNKGKVHNINTSTSKKSKKIKP